MAKWEREGERALLYWKGFLTLQYSKVKANDLLDFVPSEMCSYNISYMFRMRLSLILLVRKPKADMCIL
jgi:hypothetical protein